MSAEKSTPLDPSTSVIERFLGDKKTLHLLISTSGQVKDDLYDQAFEAIGGLDNLATEGFVKTLLNGLGRDDQEWDTDKRDGALELLELVDLSKVASDNLLNTYLDTVATQNENCDPLGSIYSLIDAGKIISESLPKETETKQKLARAWLQVAGHFEGEENQFIIEQGSNLLSRIEMEEEELVVDANREKLGWRDAPSFQEPEKALHDLYLDTVVKQTTFKPVLWDNTSDFRTNCGRYGIDLERFWNINEPDEAVKGLEKVRLHQSPYLQHFFEIALKQKTGLALNELTEPQTRILTDEIIAAAKSARGEILRSINNFPELVSKFRSLINEARNQPRKNQNSILKPIKNFLKENGVEAKGDLNFVEEVFNDSSTMGMVENKYNSKQGSKREAISLLDTSFSLPTKPDNFSLASRTRTDLFLGDLTGDCTAYHLNIGMNAWTVPIWLSDPGFNFFNISEKDNLVAKLGIMLAVADSKPALVMDSFEVAKGINNESRARELILQGLEFLGRWSEKIGLQKIFINTSSNSTGALEIFQGISKRSNVEELYLAGGLSGISELRTKALGQSEKREKIYLQTAEEGEVSVGGERVNNEQIQPFEEMISQTIQNASEENRGVIENLAREANWTELFKYIINVNFPMLAESLGNNWEIYQELMDALEADYSGVHIKQQIVFEFNGRPASSALQIYLAEQAALNPGKIDNKDGDLNYEANEMDDFLERLKWMEYNHFTPQEALQVLYRVTEVSRFEQKVMLSSSLPILNIPPSSLRLS